MRVVKVTATEVTLPILAGLRHSYGVHEAFTRTIVRVQTDTGLEGLGETAAAASRVEEIGQAAIGLDPFATRVLRARISDRFYWSSESLVAAALEMAFIDLQGKATDRTASEVLGGAIRSEIGVAGYLFFEYGHGDDRSGDVNDPATMVAHARRLVEKYGFSTLKLKGGVLRPEAELDVMEALRAEFGPDMLLRIDPNAAWTPLTASRMVPRCEQVGLEYLEDPTSGLAGMAGIRSRTQLPLATNMCVVDFDELAPASSMGSVDVVLADLWYWGGPTQVQLLARMCETYGLAVGMHSGIELGIGMAAMLHTATTIPNLTAGIDAHYIHLGDDVIKGPMLALRNGCAQPPDGPGWGVELDEEKIEHYAQVHQDAGADNPYESGHRSDPDPHRPGWMPVMPAW